MSEQALLFGVQCDPFTVGVVGSEQAKFTPETERAARQAIRNYLVEYKAERVVSGGCHLGGVDIFAREIAGEMGLDFVEYAPTTLQWSGRGGYKERNEKIADNSHVVLCVTLRELPPGYRGMRFDGCYHCGDLNPPHVKSGGCWTAWHCPYRSWAII